MLQSRTNIKPIRVRLLLAVTEGRFAAVSLFTDLNSLIVRWRRRVARRVPEQSIDDLFRRLVRMVLCTRSNMIDENRRFALRRFGSMRMRRDERDVRVSKGSMQVNPTAARLLRASPLFDATIVGAIQPVDVTIEQKLLLATLSPDDLQWLEGGEARGHGRRPSHRSTIDVLELEGESISVKKSPDMFVASSSIVLCVRFCAHVSTDQGNDG